MSPSHHSAAPAATHAVRVGASAIAFAMVNVGGLAPGHPEGGIV